MKPCACVRNGSLCRWHMQWGGRYHWRPRDTPVPLADQGRRDAARGAAHMALLLRRAASGPASCPLCFLLFPWPHRSGPKINQLPQGSNLFVSISSAGASPPAAAFLFRDRRGRSPPTPSTLSGTLTAGGSPPCSPLPPALVYHGLVAPEPTVLTGSMGEPTSGCCQASREECSRCVGSLAPRYYRCCRERQGQLRFSGRQAGSTTLMPAVLRKGPPAL